MKEKFDYYNQAKAKYETLTIFGYILIGLGFIFYIPMSTGNPSNVPYFFIGIAIGGILTAVAQGGFKKLSNKFKTEFLPEEIRKIYPDCQFDVKAGFEKDLLYRTGVIKKADRYYSEDLMYGKHEGVNFRSADVKLQEVRGSGKHRRVVTVFLGRVYEFSFNKRFRSNIIVSQPTIFSGWNRIKMESVEFNSELAIYSDNEHDAFYILTPHFMERLLKLDRLYSDQISFSFINNKLYIAINTKIDTFDLKMFSSIDASILEQYEQQIKDIQAFVHDLNLDNTLFINSDYYD